jgi:hypothetical protein
MLREVGGLFAGINYLNESEPIRQENNDDCEICTDADSPAEAEHINRHFLQEHSFSPQAMPE